MRNLLKHWTDLLLGWLGVTSDTGGWDRWIAFLLVLLFVVLFDFACRLVIVRGVRRLVARASVFPTAEKANMVQRLLSAFASVGVQRAMVSTDLGGISAEV